MQLKYYLFAGEECQGRVGAGSFGNLSLFKLIGFEPQFFCKELSYFSGPRLLTHLQILHGTQYNFYLSNDTKKNPLLCRMRP
jgi:hypothetical protein